MDLEGIQTLTHATERDIDLLLVEEFKCNPRFTKRFVSAIGDTLPKPIEYVSSNVLHSKRRIYNRREIDICIELADSAGKSYLLVENKLDTTEQERQAESYREECELLQCESKAQGAYAVLVCPAQYKDNNRAFAEKFHVVITYEKLIETLQALARQTTNSELSVRLLYRADLINQAIAKGRRGYEPVERQEIGEFNRKYVELCRKHFSALKPGTSMLKPGNPSESKTMIFDSKVLPSADCLPQMRLVHQLREGNANINFYGWGNQFEAIAPTIRHDLLSTGFKVAATLNRRKGGNSGLMIYAETPSIDNLSGFMRSK